MTHATLTAHELTELIQRVFRPQTSDRSLAILIDLPDTALEDNAEWRVRRELARGWAHELRKAHDHHGLEVDVVVYRNARTNNADLPPEVWLWGDEEIPEDADLVTADAVPLTDVLRDHRLVLAPTELSATAPLKMLSKRLGFRAATMPGFASAMVPALRLDYSEVNRRVWILKELLDDAIAADFEFEVEGPQALSLHLDLRHRTAHASGGLLPDPGTAGNLPSGEAYIVPYEGEIEGDPTASAGLMPVQHSGDDEVVVYRIADNRAVEVVSEGARSREEAQRLAREPAYGNIAELGLGVLDAFGIEPIGEVLLDEKLGLHLAFGRSEHFGGQVGPSDFSSPEAVVHQDHVYIAAIQPKVTARRVVLTFADGRELLLIVDGSYVIEF